MRDPVPNTFAEVILSDIQWDIVRDALVQRGTKRASEIAGKIWEQLAPQRLRHHRGVCRCHPHGTARRDGRIAGDDDA